jgi:poly-gamma-glutamate capsule biosynthesis protein CapA/YwtB (metallophosphatase superfamily)
MRHTIRLTGDINLVGIEDPAVPFGLVKDQLHKEDIVFGNLECCLYDPPGQRGLGDDTTSGYEGLYAPAKSGASLNLAGYHGVGNANNQNYGAEAIMASNARLDELAIAHCGTGANRKAAWAPIIIERNGLRCGILQRTSQYWPNNHEAGDTVAGVATMKAYTAYQPPYYKTGGIPPNRPGMPATVVTWTDTNYLAQYREEVAALRKQADIVIASHHWGYGDEVLEYMQEIAHAAIESGADIVMGHGPHHPMPIEIYRNKPIYYGLGMFCFAFSNKKRHFGWTGMTANFTLEDKQLVRAAYSLVRQDERTQVLLRSLRDETEQATRVAKLSQQYGTSIELDGDEGVVWRR